MTENDDRAQEKEEEEEEEEEEYDDDTLLDDLVSYCEHLMKRSSEDSLMLATLRVLLLKHGVFSEQEFDAAYQAMGALKDPLGSTTRVVRRGRRWRGDEDLI